MEAHMGTYKIFNSLLYLNYKNSKLEAAWIKKSEEKEKENIPILLKCITGYSLLIFIFICLLMINGENRTSSILSTHFKFSLFNLILTAGPHLFYLYKLFDGRLTKDLIILILFFTFENNESILTSLMTTFFKCRLEIVSFQLLILGIIKFLICIFVFKKFSLNVTLISSNLICVFPLLLGVYDLNDIITYFVIKILKNMIGLIFVYSMEFSSKILFFSFTKLEKEREYNLETMKFFNISYFKANDYKIKRHTKLDELLQLRYVLSDSETFSSEEEGKPKVTVQKIEHLFKYMVTMNNLPKEMENYILNNQKKFKMKKFIKIMKKSDANNLFIDGVLNEKSLFNFRKIGVLKLLNDHKEEVYYQMFLRVKIKIVDGKESVKIEGIFHDITVEHLKKQTQMNSLILSKYIHDIKTPLFLLKQVVKKYKHENEKFFFNLQPFLERNNSSESDSEDTNNKITIPSEKKDVLINSFSEIQNYSKYLTIISKHIFQLIQSINNFTKKQNNVEEGGLVKNETKFEKINLKALIKSCIEFFQILIIFNPTKQEVKLNYSIDATVPEFINSHEVSIKGAIMNLLSNAFKFTNKGEVKIVCSNNTRFELSEKQFLEIAVVDSGCGIDEESIQKLCQPYKITTSGKYGSGLGLSIVNDFLKNLDTKLKIDSKMYKGSVFSFEILIDNNHPNELNSKMKSSSEEASEESSAIKNKINESESKISKVSKKSNKSKDVRSTPKINMNLILNSFQSDVDASIDFNEEDQTKEFNNSLDYNFHNNTVQCKKELLFYHSDCKSDSAAVEEYTKLRAHPSKLLSVIPRKRKTTMSGGRNHPYRHSSKKILLKENRKKKVKSIAVKKFCDDKTAYNTQGLNFDPKLLNDTKRGVLRILIIDDDPIYINQLSNQINKLSQNIKVTITVDSAYDPIEGLINIYTLHKTKKDYYDLILLDENMPYMKGSSFACFYRNNLCSNGLYKMPIASISSDSLNAPNIKNFVDYFLDKPLNKNDIKNIIMSILNSK